ncbi:hypothetical protein WMF37_21800 [Sorangium sp. So ce291]|uniref:hypothetical protein n=1 Tax=Sorangium sp. So ce291 TaxID=3133294 RepID=UPI003F5D918B
MSPVHGIPVVDLVVLIDSSESMKYLADTLSKVVGTAGGMGRPAMSSFSATDR